MAPTTTHPEPYQPFLAVPKAPECRGLLPLSDLRKMDAGDLSSLDYVRDLTTTWVFATRD